MPVPVDLASVFDESTKTWWVYFMGEKYPQWLQGPQSGVKEENFNEKYKPSPAITFPKDLPSVNPNNKQLGVCEYKNAQGLQTRIYYIDKDNKLVELCWTQGIKDWYAGSLIKKNISVEPGSPLTVIHSNGEHKVYYRGADGKGGQQLWVAYTLDKQDAWATHAIYTFQ